MFIENDYSKFDRQTDMDVIDVEMKIYENLGMDKQAVKLYRKMHEKWYYWGDDIQGLGFGKRLTGQASTSIGNVIVNMLCMKDLIIKNK